MKKNIILVIILVLALTGCQSGSTGSTASTISAEQVQQWAQQTIQAMVTGNTANTTVPVIPRSSPTSSLSLIQPTKVVATVAIATPRPAIPTVSYVQPVQKVCDQMGFITDVSIPDDTVLYPNQTFQKVWRIQNTGTCTWTPSYQFIFTSGHQLGSTTAVNLPRNVAPNETVDISVDMQAPNINGTYQGFWKMRNASGTTFGTSSSASGTDAIWVKIAVNQGTGQGNVPTSGYVGTGTCSVMSIVPASNNSFYTNQETDFSVTVRNDSATTWTAANYDIAFTGGTNFLKRSDGVRFDVQNDVAPGQTLTFGLDVITPGNYGTYTMQWGIVKGYEIVCPIYFTANVNK